MMKIILLLLFFAYVPLSGISQSCCYCKCLDSTKVSNGYINVVDNFIASEKGRFVYKSELHYDSLLITPYEIALKNAIDTWEKMGENPYVSLRFSTMNSEIRWVFTSQLCEKEKYHITPKKYVISIDAKTNEIMFKKKWRRRKIKSDPYF